LDFEPSSRDCVDPAFVTPAAGEDERVHAIQVDHGEFNLAIKRRA
jgi:hypothetical protein